MKSIAIDLLEQRALVEGVWKEEEGQRGKSSVKDELELSIHAKLVHLEAFEKNTIERRVSLRRGNDQPMERIRGGMETTCSPPPPFPCRMSSKANERDLQKPNSIARNVV